MTNLDSIFKSRDITLPTKVHLVKAMVFPVVMYGCEKGECRRIDAFELWCWRRFLRVPWTERKSNQSIPKEISPECSLEALMLKLKRQYFGHLMQRTDSLEKTLILGGDWRQEEKRTTEDEMVGWHHQLNGHEFEQALGVGEEQGSQAFCSPWGRRVGQDWETELNWTEAVQNSLEGEENEKGIENALAKNFQNLKKKRDILVQEALRVTTKMNPDSHHKISQWIWQKWKREF